MNTHLFGTGSNITGLNIGYDANGGTGWFGAVGGVAFVGTVGTGNYTADTWIHLAVVRDNGTSTFYVNGVASGTAGNAPNDATTPHMAVTSGATPTSMATSPRPASSPSTRVSSPPVT